MYQIYSDNNSQNEWTLDITLPGFTLPFTSGNQAQAANYIYLRRCLVVAETLEPQDADVWMVATRDAIAKCYAPQTWSDYLANPWEVEKAVQHLADGLESGANLFLDPPEDLQMNPDNGAFLVEAQKLVDKRLMDKLEVSSLPLHWSERLA